MKILLFLMIFIIAVGFGYAEECNVEETNLYGIFLVELNNPFLTVKSNLDIGIETYLLGVKIIPYVGFLLNLEGRHWNNMNVIDYNHDIGYGVILNYEHFTFEWRNFPINGNNFKLKIEW